MVSQLLDWSVFVASYCTFIMNIIRGSAILVILLKVVCETYLLGSATNHFFYLKISCSIFWSKTPFRKPLVSYLNSHLSVEVQNNFPWQLVLLDFKITLVSRDGDLRV